MFFVQIFSKLSMEWTDLRFKNNQCIFLQKATNNKQQQINFSSDIDV